MVSSGEAVADVRSGVATCKSDDCESVGCVKSRTAVVARDERCGLDGLTGCGSEVLFVLVVVVVVVVVSESILSLRVIDSPLRYCSIT